MNEEYGAQQGPRGTVLFFLWNRMPRFVLLTIFLLLVMLAGEIKKENALVAPDAGLPTPAVALTLTPGTIYDRVNLTGSVEPWNTVHLLSQVTGTVEKILVKAGQKVRKGDVLATIGSRDCRIPSEQRPAAGVRTTKLDSTTAVKQDPGIDPGDAGPQYDAGCAVTAPMNGMVRQLQAKVGQQLSLDDPLAEILEMDRVKAVVGIPEADVTAVRGLTTVNVAVKALGDRVVTGKVQFLSSSPETADRLFRLELSIDNSGGEILPGMSVRADVVKRVVENAIVIPVNSVISSNSEPYVYVENAGEVEKRPVKLGVIDKWLVEVREGLSAGDHLLVEGPPARRQKVEVVKAAADMKEQAF